MYALEDALYESQWMGCLKTSKTLTFCDDHSSRIHTAYRLACIASMEGLFVQSFHHTVHVELMDEFTHL